MKRAIPSIILFGFLLIPGFVWATGLGQVADENRELTQWPDFDFESLRTAEAFGITEQAVVDRLPLRTEAAEVNSEVLLRALNQSSDPRVVPGRQSWLFYADAVEQACLETTGADLGAVAERSERLLRSTGRSFHLLIAPDKAAIYPDLLDMDTCTESNTARLVELADSAPFVLYPAAELSELRSDPEANVDPYFQWDTHWNQVGASLGAASVVRSLSSDLWSVTALYPAEPTSHVGDLAVMLGIDREETGPALVTRRPNATMERLPIENLPDMAGVPMPSAPRILYSSTGEPGSLIGGKAVILHDSFGWSMLPQLSPYFESLETVKYRPIDEASAVPIAESNHVILEIVQRNIVEAVVGAGLDARLAEVLHDELTEIPSAVSYSGGAATVIAELPTSCTSGYLIMDRPESGEVSYSVNDERVWPREQTLFYASSAPDTTWRVDGASKALTDAAKVVAVCG